MHNFKRYILICVGFLLCTLAVKAELVGGNHLRISLITCTPGVDAYSHFGHTAIHVVDDSLHSDAVFNYGCFDYREQNFVMNFIKGDTNYQLNAEPGDFFFNRYRQDGHGVVEQELNLTDEEKEELFRLLLLNIRPENQTYLYNWLYDNCTERARDVIEKAIDGKVEYRRHMAPITARQMLHECLENAAWLELGINFLLGEEIDRFLDQRVQMFIPAHYEAEADEAVIVDKAGNQRPLVKKKTIASVEAERPTSDFPIHPKVVLWALALAAVALLAYDRKRQKLSIWFDAPLLVIQGTAGCIVAFLFFFSKHPAVDSNWWVIALNPLPLIYAPYMAWCIMKGKKDWLAKPYVAMMMIFLLCTCLKFICKQDFGWAIHPLSVIFITRTLARLNYEKQLNEK